MKKLLALVLALMMMLPVVTALAASDTDFHEGATAVVSEDEQVMVTSFKQSPMLDDKGLPPVEERLPIRPKLYNSLSPDQVELSIGKYGGTLRSSVPYPEWNPNIWAMNNEPLINTPGIKGEVLTPNVLESFEMSEDMTTFTFKIREGIKWSDGVPVTTEDVDFTFNDYWLNKDLNPALPPWYYSPAGTPLEMKVLDDYTFQLVFDVPNGGFLIIHTIKNWVGYTTMLRPKHYLKNFHIKYTDEATLNALCEENSIEEGGWAALFRTLDIDNWSCNSPNAIGFPTLEPWMIVSANDTISIFERNPYYFKVDAEGNQLPYIDRLISEHLQDTESVNLKLISGEVDFGIFETALTNMPLYLQNAEANGYKVIMSDWHVTPADIYFKFSYPDEKWQEIMQDKRFRQALNYAFNREDVIDTIYYGFAETSNLINGEYNLDKANALLDEIGMPMGNDGYRTYADGDPFSIDIEYADRTPDMKMVAEMFTAFMADIGIKINTKIIDSQVLATRQTANEVQATIIWSEIIWYNQGEWQTGEMGTYWSWWATKGVQGMEPPEEFKTLFKIYDDMNALPPSMALNRYQDMIDSWNENTWAIRYMKSIQQPVIANLKLKNCDTIAPTWGIGLTFGGEIFYFDE